ncbi:MAG: acyl-CoA dehydrogenase family protein [Acidimicrobiales bacterium]|nr:acyl-CoA dehydrogenase family protein [Acidimicrobiales bacterium]
MDLEFGEHHARLRDEVEAFLTANWPSDDVRAFRRKAIDVGYLYRHFPAVYGGSEQPADPMADDIIESAFTAARAPQGIIGQGPDMVVPTLLMSGNDAQRERFIEPTLLGDISWCQGYSEPTAGSDLASLRSKAELDGDEWVVNGHKIWTSDADTSDWMFGLFRTEPDQPRHHGITFLLIPMDQPGIEVTPIQSMTGETEFCEVFLTDARTSIDCQVGERGGGWGVSRNLLVHERNLMGFRTQQLFESMLELARTRQMNGAPAIEDAGVRRSLIEIEGELLAAKYSRYRSLTNSARGNPDPNAALAGVVKKLHASTMAKKLTQLGLDLAGADEGLRAQGDASVDLGRANEPGGWTANYLFTHSSAIGGGAPNIQRNIIGERGLGLPRDLRTPKESTPST